MSTLHGLWLALTVALAAFGMVKSAEVREVRLESQLAISKAEAKAEALRADQLDKADRAGAERERQRDIRQAALEAARRAIREFPSDNDPCLDVRVPDAIASLLRDPPEGASVQLQPAGGGAGAESGSRLRGGRDVPRSR